MPEKVESLLEVPVSCGCSSEFHETQVAKTKYNMSPNTLFQHLCGRQVIDQVVKSKKGSNIQIGDWFVNKHGWQERKVEYSMPIKVAIIGGNQQVVDVEMVISGGPNLYVFERHSIAPNTPYHDDFIPMMRLCLTPVESGATELTASIWIRWIHKPMLVKGQIDKATMDGLRQTVNEFMTALKSIPA